MYKGFIVFLIHIFLLNGFTKDLQFSLYSGGEVPPSRKILLLNEKWELQSDDNSEIVKIPFFFSNEQITLKKKIRIDSVEKNSNYQLVFKGVKGLREVYINDERLPFDPTDNEQFVLNIPTRIVKEKSDNWIKIILSNKSILSIKNTLSANLELAERKSGIYKDVFLQILSNPAIVYSQVIPSVDKNLNLGRLKYKVEIFANSFSDSLTDYYLNILVTEPITNKQVIAKIEKLNLLKNTSSTFTGELLIQNPMLWEPGNPFLYRVAFQLLSKNDIHDEVYLKTGFRNILIENNQIILNGNVFELKGITYFESNVVNSSFFNIKDYARDVQFVKELGANAIRVMNSIPSEELLNECNEQGVLVFFDLIGNIYPLNSNTFEKIRNYSNSNLGFILNKLTHFPCIVGINLGDIQNYRNDEFFRPLINILDKNNYQVLKFGIIQGKTIKNISGLDFVGLDLKHKSVDEIKSIVNKFSDKGFLLVLFLGYLHNYDSEEGYANPYSVQRQAKYLSDVIGFLQEEKLPFFIHTLFDYRISYKSVIAGKIDNTLMNYGLVNEFRDKRKLSFQTVRSYFLNSKLPFIMQGDYEEKANIIFVFAGLMFLGLTILIVNSTRRLKENITRAVLRTYNFFADIRDGWFIPSFHSFLLGFVIILTNSLLYSGVFYYLKDKIIFEEIISIFNSNYLFNLLSYLSWRPIESILILSLILSILLIILTLLIQFFNLFVRNKIYLKHSLLISVWSAIPFLITLPLGMIVFKVLQFNKFNLLIWAVIILFHLWFLFRLLYGISIVFEVKKSKVNLIFIFIVIISLVIFILYFQFNYYSIDYLRYFLG